MSQQLFVRTVLGLLALSVTTTACAVKLNGKTYGGSGTPSSGTAGGAPAGAAATSTPGTSTAAAGAPQSPAPPPSAGCRAPTGREYSDQPPVLSSPANPWLAVAGDQPVMMKIDSQARLIARDTETQCDAAHDHCFRDCTWIVEFDSIAGAQKSKTRSTREVVAAHRVPEGFEMSRSARVWSMFNNGEDDGYTAYRTVPATKRLLREGALVVVPVEQGIRVPDSEKSALGEWVVGKLGDVDWETNQLYLQRVSKPYHLSAARIVVLTYRKGGKVELAEGFTKDEIVVGASEVIAVTSGAE